MNKDQLALNTQIAKWGEAHGIWKTQGDVAGAILKAVEADHEAAHLINDLMILDLMQVAAQVTGSSNGFDDADAMTVSMIADRVRRMPVLSAMAKVGLTAIAELSKTDPDLARSLVSELSDRSGRQQ